MRIERVETLRVVSCLVEDIRFLRQTSATRLKNYSLPFVMELRKELQDFSQDLAQLVNQKMKDQSGDDRPLVVIDGDQRRLP